MVITLAIFGQVDGGLSIDAPEVNIPIAGAVARIHQILAIGGEAGPGFNGGLVCNLYLLANEIESSGRGVPHANAHHEAGHQAEQADCCG